MHPVGCLTCKHDALDTIRIANALRYSVIMLQSETKFGTFLGLSDIVMMLSPPTFSQCGGNKVHAIFFRARLIWHRPMPPTQH